MFFYLSKDKLRDFLKTDKDWSTLKTSVLEVFILRLLAYKSSPTRLVVELNPMDSARHFERRRGPIMRTSADLSDFERLFQYDTLLKSLSLIESVNPKAEAMRRRIGEEVLEL